jgi:hypothetical protein
MNKKEPQFAKWIGPQRYANTDPNPRIPFVDPDLPDAASVVEWLVVLACAAIVVAAFW